MEKNAVFSDYEIRSLGFIFDESDAVSVPCVGSVEEELDVLTVTKKCRGVASKVRARGKGTGTVKVSAHMPVSAYNKIYAMDQEGLKDGVSAYGTSSMHPEFSMTADVYDEDGNEKLKAYPRCLMQSNPSRKTENGSEEVAEVELEIALMPDDDGNCVYEAICADFKEEEAKTNWMTAFKSSMVKGE